MRCDDLAIVAVMRRRGGRMMRWREVGRQEMCRCSDRLSRGNDSPATKRVGARSLNFSRPLLFLLLQGTILSVLLRAREMSTQRQRPRRRREIVPFVARRRLNRSRVRDQRTKVEESERLSVLFSLGRRQGAFGGMGASKIP
jgi:hypothetical protein